ncbi:hypothetical protein, partial [Streptomyces poriferorum]
LFHARCPPAPALVCPLRGARPAERSERAATTHPFSVISPAPCRAVSGRGATGYQTIHIRQEVKITPSVMNPEL